MLIGRSHELPAQDVLKYWFTWRRQRSAGDDSLVRRRSSRTVACGSSPAGNPRRRQYMASREPVIVCQKVATAQGAATAALRYCRGRIDPAGYFQVMQARRVAAWLC